MTTATYNVQQGDTLGHIAQRFGISSAELQRLNPFISNPNYVRAGWVLKVPDSVVAPSPDAAASAPEPVVEPVLQLKPIAAAPEHCTIDFCGEQRCGKAAEAGHFDATLNYARWAAHMPDQVDYPIDLVKAYGLTLLLAEADPGPDWRNLSDSETMLPKIAAKMTAEQIEAGKAYAKDWAKFHPPLSKFPPKYGF